MPTAKVAVTIEKETLKKLDRLVKRGIFPNRSTAVQVTLAEKLATLDREKFEMECQKLHPTEEQRLAQESLTADTEWPEY